MTTARKKITSGALLLACLALGSGFQSSSDQKATGSTEPRSAGSSQQPMTYNKASGLVGMNVKNQADERLGEIKDIVFDLQSERVGYAVLGYGGLLNRDKMIAVPLSAFTPSADGKHLVLRTDKSKLEAATGFERDNWPSVTNPSWGAQPFWEKPDKSPDVNRKY